MDSISIRWVKAYTHTSNPFGHEDVQWKASEQAYAFYSMPEWWLRISGCSTEEQQLHIEHYAKVTGGLVHLLPRLQTQEHVILLEASPHRLHKWQKYLLHTRPGSALECAFSLWCTRSLNTPQKWSIHSPTGQVHWSFPRERPLLMGIVNVTPDSFSDGGQFLASQQAIEHGLQLEEEGAGVLDIGGESTRPGAAHVDADEECARILPVIQGLAQKSSIPLSIDTYKAPVAEAALSAGARIVNDISCMRFDPELASVVADHDAYLILMHSRHRPTDMQKKPHYDNMWDELLRELEQGIEHALRAGVTEDKIAIDPGIGFGKRIEDNYQILKEFKVLRSFGKPILIGASRKSFIGALSNTEANQRLEGSLAAAALAHAHKTELLRVHDVQETKRFLDILHAADFPHARPTQSQR